MTIHNVESMSFHERAAPARTALTHTHERTYDATQIRPTTHAGWQLRFVALRWRGCGAAQLDDGAAALGCGLARRHGNCNAQQQLREALHD